MNLIPGQWAWIDCPRTPRVLALGIDQLHGHVVQLVGLHPEAPGGERQWVVDPPQKCKVPEDIHANGVSVRKGTVFNFEAVPEPYLRPFKDFPPEELRTLQRELAS